MIPFRRFSILCKACLQAKHHHLKIVNMPFMKHKHNTYEAQTWPLAIHWMLERLKTVEETELWDGP